jgi:hypothetical protein
MKIKKALFFLVLFFQCLVAGAQAVETIIDCTGNTKITNSEGSKILPERFQLTITEVGKEFLILGKSVTMMAVVASSFELPGNVSFLNFSDDVNYSIARTFKVSGKKFNLDDIEFTERFYLNRVTGGFKFTSDSRGLKFEIEADCKKTNKRF